MVLRERRWAYSDLEFMYMKLVKLEHHHENFFRAISDEIVPYGLRLKKSPQISSTSDEFKEKWNAVLGEAERALIGFLFDETRRLADLTRLEFEEKLSHQNPPQNIDFARNKIRRKFSSLEKELHERRERKFKKFRGNQHRQRSRFKHVTDNRRCRIARRNSTSCEI